MTSNAMPGIFITLAEDPFLRPWLRTPSATAIGRDTDSMFMFLWWFCVVWFVALMGLMVYWAVKYRRRPGKIAERSSAHNTPLEIAWTVIPTLMLVYIFFRGFHGYLEKMVAPGNATSMQLSGMQWNWQLIYPNGAETPMTDRMGAKEVPVFYFPENVPIKLLMQSRDVMHAFWVPDFRIKQDVLPNRLMQVWFQAEGVKAPGAIIKTHQIYDEKDPRLAKQKYLFPLSGKPYTEHRVFCAEYCGDDHSEMTAIIRIVDQDTYKAWLTEIGTPGDPIELGKQVFKTKCASCHTIDGGKSVGPSWKDLYGKMETLTDGSQVLVDDAYLTESIFDPQAKIVKGFEGQAMTSFRGLLTPVQMHGVMEFMKSISQHAPKEPAAAGESK